MKTLRACRAFLFLYSWRYPTTLVYMQQACEYHAPAYLKWYWRVTDFSAVMRRRTLETTRVARLLLLAMRLGILLEITAGALFIYWDRKYDLAGGWEFGVALIVAWPVVWAHLIVVPLLLGRLFITWPRERRYIKKSEIIFRKHPGIKIAITGSYGKTSMKELLLTVLSEGKRVAATPANKNVSISHAQFARHLSGDEEVLLIEYGEGEPGDVARFARTTHPTHAVITGLAPAHLDRYKTLRAAGEDIFSVARAVKPDHVFVNGESPQLRPYLKKQFVTYDAHGCLGWKVRDVQVGITGTSFVLKKGKDTLHVQSALLGRHQIGPLSLVAALAHEFGLTNQQIEAGLAKTAPFEHRMQPYNLGGAWIIDDTYNGNIEGVRAGTQLLKELPATRKIYITPGLVDQGEETESVHTEMGRLIAAAQPDIVVLMQNSVTEYIQQGLAAGKFKGRVMAEQDPLEFYTNLNLFVAAGDVVLMQNDWTDNYN